LRLALAATSLIVTIVPTLGSADRCSELATPARFDAASAMRAIFCEYDEQRRATLLPPRLTPGWKEKAAHGRAFPLFAGTYEEGDIKRGALVVGRREFTKGEMVLRQNEWLGLSLYVFKQKDGRFVFERGARDWITSWRGTEPGIELVKAGPDRFLLSFRHDWWLQGNTGKAVSLWSLSEPGAPELLWVQTHDENEGSCSHQKDDDLPPCWSYDSEVELLPGSDGWGLVRVERKGTEAGEGQGEVVPARQVTCYARTGAKYEEVPAERCGPPRGATSPKNAPATAK
jgi:hypothetical protein